MKKLIIFLLLLMMCQVFAQENQNIHINKIIAKLERNEIVSGIWAHALHPTNAIGLVEMNGFPDAEEALTKPMIDYILIDMEHEPFAVQELRNFLLALNSKREVMVKGNLQPNISPLVRIPADGGQPVHAMIKQVLDVGVHGVVVPHVKNAQEAEKIVSACRYPQPPESKYQEPSGTRGASPWLCAYLWGLSSPDYIARADVWPLNPKGDILAIIMIEDVEGVKNINSILSVKGLGAVIFGPYDYSFSCGHPGIANHPDVFKAWDIVKEACDRVNVPLVGFPGVQKLSKCLEDNYRMLLFGRDVANNGSISKILNILKNSKRKP